MATVSIYLPCGSKLCPSLQVSPRIAYDTHSHYTFAAGLLHLVPVPLSSHTNSYSTSNSSTMSEPLPLTFGVELEFVALYPRRAFNNQEPDLLPTSEELDGEVTAGHALQYFLDKANVPATGWEELGSVPFDAAPSYSKWCVKEDCVQLSTDESDRLPDGFIEEPIEICSRILFYGDDWRGEIRAVLNVLAFMGSRFNAGFIINSTTGFHVHVGNNAGQPMPFDTVKRIFQVATAHERVIDSLHASSRVLAPFSIESVDPHMSLLYGPLSFFHLKTNDGYGSHVFDWLRRIEDMHNFEDLCEIFDGQYNDYPLSGHSSVVNFDNLWSETQEDLKNTVEFRQHVGTLDYAEIVAWVSFLTRFVYFCHSACDDDIMELTLRATDPEFTITDLMLAIGCEDDIIQHYQFDEDDVIGMLPQAGSIIQADPIALLTEQNDEEVTSNTDRFRVKRITNTKLRKQYYGFNSALGMLPLDQRMLQDMLRRAFEQVSQRQFNDRGLVTLGGKSQARALVFGVLSAMHRAYDPTEGPWQVAIANGIRRLM